MLDKDGFYEILKPLVIFARCFSDGTLAIEGDHPVDMPRAQLFYSCSAVCGERTLFGLGTRPFTGIERKDSLQRITFGSPKIVDMYVHRSDETNDTLHRHDFSSRLEAMSETTIGLADLDVLARKPGGEVIYQVHTPSGKEPTSSNTPDFRGRRQKSKAPDTSGA